MTVKNINRENSTLCGNIFDNFGAHVRSNRQNTSSDMSLSELINSLYENNNVEFPAFYYFETYICFEYGNNVNSWLKKWTLFSLNVSLTRFRRTWVFRIKKELKMYKYLIYNNFDIIMWKSWSVHLFFALLMNVWDEYLWNRSVLPYFTAYVWTSIGILCFTTEIATRRAAL